MLSEELQNMLEQLMTLRKTVAAVDSSEPDHAIFALREVVWTMLLQQYTLTYAVLTLARIAEEKQQ